MIRTVATLSNSIAFKASSTHGQRLVALAHQPGDQPFAAPVAVDVGGVEDGDAVVDRGVQRTHRFLVIDRAPGAADGPGAEGDLGHAVAGLAEGAVVHRGAIAVVVGERRTSGPVKE